MKYLALLIIPAIAVGYYALVMSNVEEEPKSVFNYSKAEYIDHATEGCAVDGNPENYCRCVYTGLLEDYTVREVLRFDAAVAADPNYKFTEEQLEIVARCI